MKCSEASERRETVGLSGLIYAEKTVYHVYTRLEVSRYNDDVRLYR